jgi:hypothetical protein
VAYGLLQLGAIARYVDQVQWDEAGAWIWLVLLIDAIVTGGTSCWPPPAGPPTGGPRSSAEPFISPTDSRLRVFIPAAQVATEITRSG